jgi:beta-lactamase regulating signal transducer with metallopeptidase domain
LTDEKNTLNDSDPVSGQARTPASVSANPTPRTIENVLASVSEVWVVGCLILLEGLSLLFVVVGLSFFRVVRRVVCGILLGV